MTANHYFLHRLHTQQCSDSMRTGGPQAVTATAHKIARIYYAMLTKRTGYIELGQQAYEQRFQQRRINSLKSQAKLLGFQLVPCEA